MWPPPQPQRRSEEKTTCGESEIDLIPHWPAGDYWRLGSPLPMAPASERDPATMACTTVGHRLRMFEEWTNGRNSTACILNHTLSRREELSDIIWHYLTIDCFKILHSNHPGFCTMPHIARWWCVTPPFDWARLEPAQMIQMGPGHDIVA